MQKSDEIAELTELMECYRDYSEAERPRPIASAYAEAAKDLEEIIARLKRTSPLARLPAPSEHHC